MDEPKVTVIDDRDREEAALSLCKWAAARAGAIVVLPGLGTLSTVANDVYLLMKIGKVYEDGVRYARENIGLFRDDPKKDEPLGDEKKKFDVGGPAPRPWRLM